MVRGYSVGGDGFQVLHGVIVCLPVGLDQPSVALGFCTTLSHEPHAALHALISTPPCVTCPLMVISTTSPLLPLWRLLCGINSFYHRLRLLRIWQDLEGHYEWPRSLLLTFSSAFHHLRHGTTQQFLSYTTHIYSVNHTQFQSFESVTFGCIYHPVTHILAPRNDFIAIPRSPALNITSCRPTPLSFAPYLYL